MTISRPPQSWQIINEEKLDILETYSREPLDNLFSILNKKLDFPFRTTVYGAVVTIGTSEVQVLKSDEAGSTTDSFKIATAPLENKYIIYDESSFNVSDGTVTGDFDPLTSPTMIAGNYVWVGIEANSLNKLGLIWGTQDALQTNATYPTFTSGNTAVALILLKDNGSGGSWNFNDPLAENVIVFRGSGGGSGGGSGTSYYFLEIPSTSVNFNSGTFTWTETMYVVHPFYGKYPIPSGSLGSIVNNDVLYAWLYTPQKATGNGTILGTLPVTDFSYFNDNDAVTIGDANSVQVTGYVNGTPISTTLNIDDGLGTPINLSAFTIDQGAWIMRTNLTLQKGQINTGDLKPDSNNKLPSIFIVGLTNGKSVFLSNGKEITWTYEESVLNVAAVLPEDELTLPTDSRDSYSTRYYKNGSGELEVFANGLALERNKVALVSSFLPTSYTSGTGVLRVPDSVDLSVVTRGCTFKDFAGNTFVIYGGVINDTGNKQFNIGVGKTVSLLIGATVYQQDYAEYGSAGQFVNKIISKTFIDSNSIFKYRIS